VKHVIWSAFLASVLVGFGIFHIWGMTEIAFRTLEFVRSQIVRDDLQPAVQGRHVEDIAGKDHGIIALGVNNEGDYAPLIMQADGAVRVAGKNVQTGPEWVAIAVDKQGRVIVSPHSLRIAIEGPPETNLKRRGVK